MAPFDVPSTPSNREILTIGVIISAMVYGSVATLFLTYISLLLKTSHAISPRLCNFLLAYVVFMVSISTVNTVTLITAFTIGRNILPFGDSKSGTTDNIINFAYISKRNGRSTVCYIGKLGCRRLYGEFIDSNLGGSVTFYLCLAMAVCGVI